MIGAIGCIDLIDATNHVYIVSVHWQGLASTAAPQGVLCNNGGATGKYGNEKLHRVVSTVLQIGKLL
jgi:type IV pilus assembly protein PilV